MPPFRRERRQDERVQVLGCEMDLIRPEEVLHQVSQRLAEGRQTIVANHNLHSLYLYPHDETLREFYRISDLIEVDSTPILTWARLTQRRGRPFHRCTYLDWRNAFWALAARNGWRVFYLGGAPGVAERAAERLRAEWPGVTIGVRDGYFDMTSDAAAVRRQIDDFTPDVVLVGMGMPRQEAWVVHNRRALPACAIFTVGAAFDYEAGVQKAAPRWMGRLGVEWLFRLTCDPRRLFVRYCIEPWSLIGRALADVVRSARRG
jgi:N-acetylglucosaminyldiphosphoundecaprenol N-acetyl-beta-D-mannosaminyltransferase